MLASHVTGGSVSYIEQQFVTERQNGSMLVIRRIRSDLPSLFRILRRRLQSSVNQLYTSGG